MVYLMVYMNRLCTFKHQVIMLTYCLLTWCQEVTHTYVRTSQIEISSTNLKLIFNLRSLIIPLLATKSHKHGLMIFTKMNPVAHILLPSLHL